MYIPPWAWNQQVPPEMNKAWAKAVAGTALAVLMTGSYCEADRLHDQATGIEPLSAKQAAAKYPGLKSYFTEANRDLAVEACHWRNTPTPECADTREVKQVADELRHQASLANLGALILGVGAIGALGAALRQPKGL